MLDTFLEPWIQGSGGRDEGNLALIGEGSIRANMSLDSLLAFRSRGRQGEVLEGIIGQSLESPPTSVQVVRCPDPEGGHARRGRRCSDET